MEKDLYLPEQHYISLYVKTFRVPTSYAKRVLKIDIIALFSNDICYQRRRDYFIR